MWVTRVMRVTGVTNFHVWLPSVAPIAPRSHISSSLAKVKGQLNNDAHATHELLKALEHQGRVQAVSSSVGLFFVADRAPWFTARDHFPYHKPGTRGGSCFSNRVMDTDTEIVNMEALQSFVDDLGYQGLSMPEVREW